MQHLDEKNGLFNGPIDGDSYLTCVSHDKQKGLHEAHPLCSCKDIYELNSHLEIQYSEDACLLSTVLWLNECHTFMYNLRNRSYLYEDRNDVDECYFSLIHWLHNSLKNSSSLKYCSCCRIRQIAFAFILFIHRDLCS